MKANDLTRLNALDKAMHYHATFNRREQHPAQGFPYTTETPKATSDEVIATAQKFLGFLLVERKTVAPKAKR